MDSGRRLHRARERRERRASLIQFKTRTHTSPRPPPPSTTPPSQIRSALLAWYDASHRLLPWRRNAHSVVPDAAAGGAPLDLPTNQFAYGVWVCEVMSQQTQLDRVKAYWTAWMARWPTVTALAAASEEEVRAAWAGLGYYRRARFLLEGARDVAGRLGGAFPADDHAALLKIPGIGPYTASAIASIAGGVRTAVVDGNVVRVLSRLRAVGGDPKAATALATWARLADALVDPARPGDFNQAVMELGATVCVPAGAPACGSCPVAALCAAKAGEEAGGEKVTDYPAKAAKAKQRAEGVDVCVVELSPADGGGEPLVLLTQRPEGGLLAGLWEFPSVPVAVSEEGVATAPAAARRAAVDAHLAALLGAPLPRAAAAKQQESEAAPSPPPPFRVLRRAPVGSLTHVFSHIKLGLSVESVRLAAAGPLPTGPTPAVGEPGEPGYTPAMRWLPKSAMAAEPVSSSVAKCWRLVASGGGAGGRSSAKRAGAPGGGSGGPTTAGGPAPAGGGIKRFFQPQPPRKKEEEGGGEEKAAAVEEEAKAA